MFNPAKLIELREKIQEKAKKYYITNIAIAATDPELMDYPFQFIGDYENSNQAFPSPEEHKGFLSFLQTTLSHVGISFNIRSKLVELVNYDEGYQYIFDTTIPLNELEITDSFKDQFQKRKNRADEERVKNLESTEIKKRKANLIEESIPQTQEENSGMVFSQQIFRSENVGNVGVLWADKVRGEKRSRVNIDENGIVAQIRIKEYSSFTHVS
ncbi:hypothetical protein NF27_EM00070 [Candidatus Jidaibacter acanthamoeba]|uniref:Uncharacterized protein n=1 Tax=Candidatus Jidaibacter acanthamoebae TaxID=86105 RepID=A0A0C1MYZ0_9RICK|nr:hypothetical protein [Candidatus Jidaibacter acanthamoeba]KIE05181.1 hypothetical protein NF27_EM00070 [Candidatus Jidaibacter acanthamoeba]